MGFVRVRLVPADMMISPLRSVDGIRQHQLGALQAGLSTVRKTNAFYRDRLPEQYSAVSAELARRAQESGVKLGQVKHDVDHDIPAPGVRSIHIGATVNGNYVNIAKFINALERDKMLFVPASVDLAEGQGGAVCIESERGAGTLVRLFLPRVQAAGLPSCIVGTEIAYTPSPNGGVFQVVNPATAASTS